MTTKIESMAAEQQRQPDSEEELVTCPNCLGNKKVMGFATSHEAGLGGGGWKALPCPACQGAGVIRPEEAARMKADRPATEDDLRADESRGREDT